MNKSLKFKLSYHWLIFIVGFIMVFTALGFGSSTGHSYKAAIIDDGSRKDYGLLSWSERIRLCLRRPHCRLLQAERGHLSGHSRGLLLHYGNHPDHH